MQSLGADILVRHIFCNCATEEDVNIIASLMVLMSWINNLLMWCHSVKVWQKKWTFNNIWTHFFIDLHQTPTSKKQTLSLLIINTSCVCLEKVWTTWHHHFSVCFERHSSSFTFCVFERCKKIHHVVHIQPKLVTVVL